MPLFKQTINKNNSKKLERGTDDVEAKCTEFIDIYETSFVPAFNALSSEDKIALKEMFNNLVDSKELGDLLSECDKDALIDGFNDLSV